MNGNSYGRGIVSSSLSSRQFADYYSYKRKRNSGRGSAQSVNCNITKQYNASSQFPLNSTRRTYNSIPNQPLTKQVDQLLYEIPDYKFTQNALFQPPEFLKVFSDVRCIEGATAIFDCMILGSPRPKVCWLFNNEKLLFDDVLLEDTADTCKCTIKYVCYHHYGLYTVLVENEAGRAITTAMLLPTN